MRTTGLVAGFGMIALSALACGGSDAIIDGGDGDSATNDAPSDSALVDSGGDASSVDSGGDVDGGSFDPLSVPGLVLWLEGDVAASITTQLNDAGVSKVTKWADQTSHHNDAVGFAQFPVADPTVKSGAINSLPAMHFDQGTATSGSFGQELTIADNADTSLQWGTGDFLVAIVGDFDNDPAKGAALGVGDFYSKIGIGGSTVTGVMFTGNVSTGSNSTPTAGLIFSTQTTAGNFVTTATAYNTGAPHLFALRRRGGALDLLVDGTSVASASGSNIDVSNAKSVTCIGSFGDPAFERLDGDIGEILAVKGNLSLSDEAGLIGHLKTKWKTP